MSGRFAGAGSVDGRRRRRIAGGEDAEVAAVGSADGGDAGRSVTPRVPSDSFPLRRVLSRRGWKVWLPGVLLAGVCGAAAWGTVDPAVRSGASGPGVARLFDPAAGTLVPGLVGLMLVAAGWWAFVIRWARGRSRGDFTARYRVWFTAAGVLTASGFAVLTGLPAAWSATLDWLAADPFAARLPDGVSVPWAAVPFAAAAFYLLPGLHRETRGSWAARCGLWAAVLCWSAGLAYAAAPGHLPASVPPLAAALLPAASLLGGTLACLGLTVFHARRVLYVTVEPPAGRVRAGRPVRSTDGDDAADAADTPAVAGKIEPEAADALEPEVEERTKPARRSRRPAAADAEPAEKPAADAEPTGTAGDAESGDGPATVRLEDVPTTVEVSGRTLDLTDPEGDLLKGLSKRERRTVRKALRDRERMLARAA